MSFEMMSRGSYTLKENINTESGNRNNASNVKNCSFHYRNLICLLLIAIAIGLLIVLCSMDTKKSERDNNLKGSSSRKTHNESSQESNKNRSSTQNPSTPTSQNDNDIYFPNKEKSSRIPETTVADNLQTETTTTTHENNYEIENEKTTTDIGSTTLQIKDPNDFFDIGEPNMPEENYDDLEETTVTTSVTTLNKDKAAELPSNNNIPRPGLEVIAKNSSNFECKTPECKNIASEILSLMDHSADKCEHFYDFACGGRDKKEEFADNLDLLSTSDKHAAIETFKLFHDTCIKHRYDTNITNDILQIKELVGQVGSFLTAQHKIQPNITDVFTKLILRQSLPFFEVGVDLRLGPKLTLQLTLPGCSILKIGLENWSGFSLFKKECLERFINDSNILEEHENYSNCIKNNSKFLDSIENAVREIGFFRDLGISLAEAEEEILEIKNNIADVFDKIKDFTPSKNDIFLDKSKRNYKELNVLALQQQYPFLKWSDMLKTLTGHDMGSDFVHLYSANYFDQLFQALSVIDHRKLNNVFLAFYANDLYINTIIKRESDCLNQAKSLMPDVWSKFNSKLEKMNTTSALVLFGDLKVQLEKTFESIQCMSPKRKDYLVKKIKTLSLSFYKAPNEISLEEKYSKIKLTANYPENVISLLELNRKSAYKIEGSVLDSRTIFTYFLDPLSKEPITFQYIEGMIFVPPGFLLKPRIFTRELALARLGFPLAKSLLAQYDEIGITYNEEPFISDGTKEWCNNFTENYEDQLHTNFDNPSINLTKTNPLFINDLMVEKAAVKLVSDLYKSKQEQEIHLPWIGSDYTNEQFLLISIAQEYCEKSNAKDIMMGNVNSLPGSLLVKNMMNTLGVFSQSFNCPKDAEEMECPMCYFITFMKS